MELLSTIPENMIKSKTVMSTEERLYYSLDNIIRIHLQEVNNDNYNQDDLINEFFSIIISIPTIQKVSVVKDYLKDRMVNYKREIDLFSPSFNDVNYFEEGSLLKSFLADNEGILNTYDADLFKLKYLEMLHLFQVIISRFDVSFNRLITLSEEEQAILGIECDLVLIDDMIDLLVSSYDLYFSPGVFSLHYIGLYNNLLEETENPEFALSYIKDLLSETDIEATEYDNLIKYFKRTNSGLILRKKV